MGRDEIDPKLREYRHKVSKPIVFTRDMMQKVFNVLSDVMLSHVHFDFVLSTVFLECRHSNTLLINVGGPLRWLVRDAAIRVPKPFLNA
jgi:hypothetical protein